MIDAFLTYNFKKPDFIDEQDIDKSYLQDIPFTPNLFESNNQSINLDIPVQKQEKIEVKKDIQEEQKPKILPKILPKVTNKVVTKPNVSNKLSMKDFKSQLMPEAIRIAEKLKVDPNVILAQSFLETGGDISKPLFGIKAQKGYKGKSKSYSTKEQVGEKMIGINDNFRTYDNISDSFDDYGKLISGRRYASAIGKSPEEYYNILSKQGYATAKNYSSALLKTYKSMIKS